MVCKKFPKDIIAMPVRKISGKVNGLKWMKTVDLPDAQSV